MIETFKTGKSLFSLPAYKTGSTATVTIGTEITSTLSYTGSTLNSTIGNVDDIDSPSSWTNIVNIASTCKGEFNIKATNIDKVLGLAMNSAEDSGDAIRIQAIVDGIVVADYKIVSDNASSHTVYAFPHYNPSLSVDNYRLFAQPFPFKSSIIVNAAKHGTIANAGTAIYIGAITITGVIQ